MGANAGKAARSRIERVRTCRIAFQQQPGPDSAADALSLVAEILGELDDGTIDGDREQLQLLRQVLTALRQEVRTYLAANAAPVAPVPAPAPVPPPAPVLGELYPGVDHPGTRHFAAALLRAANTAGGYQAPVPGANLAVATAAVLGHLDAGGGGDYGNAVRAAVPDIVADAYNQGYDVGNPVLQPILASLATEYMSAAHETTIGAHTGGGLRGMGFKDT